MDRFKSTMEDQAKALPLYVTGSQRPTAVLLERVGSYEIRLAENPKELKRTQRLRYKVFYEEGGAVATPHARQTRRDQCPFDPICDHLMVVDTDALARSGRRKAKVVGTYRLLRRDVAAQQSGFYSQSEFDLDAMLAQNPHARLLELGRACVHPDYRSKRIVELLWRGLSQYADQHGIDTLIGCASLPGTDPDALRVPLSFLLHHAQAAPVWQAAPLRWRGMHFEPLLPDAYDKRAAFHALPPLLKAYLRLGARCSRGVAIDHHFRTTDVFTVLPLSAMEARRSAHYRLNRADIFASAA